MRKASMSVRARWVSASAFIAITIGAATATRPWSFIVGIAARSSCTKTATPGESAAATESRATLKELPPRAGALLFCAEPSARRRRASGAETFSADQQIERPPRLGEKLRARRQLVNAFAGGAGSDDHRHFGERVVHPSRKLDAVHAAGQIDVGEQQLNIIAARLNKLPCLVGGRAFGDLEIRFLEQCSTEKSLRRVVVDNNGDRTARLMRLLHRSASN